MTEPGNDNGVLSSEQDDGRHLPDQVREEQAAEERSFATRVLALLASTAVDLRRRLAPYKGPIRRRARQLGDALGDQLRKNDVDVTVYENTISVKGDEQGLEMLAVDLRQPLDEQAIALEYDRTDGLSLEINDEHDVDPVRPVQGADRTS